MRKRQRRLRQRYSQLMLSSVVIVGGSVTLALVPMRAMATDAKIADLAQAGKIRVALFLPQHAKDSTTGQLRGIGTGAVAIDIAHALATRMGVAIELVGYPTPPA